jgi:hypothetical protein
MPALCPGDCQFVGAGGTLYARAGDLDAINDVFARLKESTRHAAKMLTESA